MECPKEFTRKGVKKRKEWEPMPYVRAGEVKKEDGLPQVLFIPIFWGLKSKVRGACISGVSGGANANVLDGEGLCRRSEKPG